MRIAIVLASLCSACTGLRDTAPVRVLVPFIEASRFVPTGMVSFAFMRDAPLHMPEGITGFTIRAGKDFEKPIAWGSGSSRSIWITDLGHGGAEQLLASFLHGIKFLHDINPQEERIGEHPCWGLPQGLGPGKDKWLTTVDDRFVLMAQHRETLAAAMAATGDLGVVLAPFGDLSFLPQDSTDMLFNLSREGEAEEWGRPVPVDLMVFAMSRDPWRLAMFSRHPAPDEYGQLLTVVWPDQGLKVTEIGGWMCQQAELKEQAPFSEAVMNRIAWSTLFGDWWML